MPTTLWVQGRRPEATVVGRVHEAPLCVLCQMPTHGVANGFPYCGGCYERLSRSGIKCAACEDTGVAWKAGGEVPCRCQAAIQGWALVPWEVTP